MPFVAREKWGLQIVKAGVEEAEEAVACQDILVVQTEEVVAVAVAVGGVVVGEGAPCRDVKVVRVACAVEAVLACWVQQPQQVQTFSVMSWARRDSSSEGPGRGRRRAVGYRSIQPWRVLVHLLPRPSWTR